jgi:hypothetical protein
MADRVSSKTDETLEGTVQNLLVSTVRLSAALTLYGLEQLQNVAYARKGRRDLSTTAERFVTTLDSLSDSLVDGMDETKKDALISLSTVARYMIRKSLESLSAALETANDLFKRASEPISSVAGREIVQTDAPQLAVDVLTGPRNV